MREHFPEGIFSFFKRFSKPIVDDLFSHIPLRPLNSIQFEKSFSAKKNPNFTSHFSPDEESHFIYYRVPFIGQ
jgi:hypothetical protein